MQSCATGIKPFFKTPENWNLKKKEKTDKFTIQL